MDKRTIEQRDKYQHAFKARGTKQENDALKIVVRSFQIHFC